MSNLRVQHPEDGLLLRYIDGELPARKSRQVKKHLEACWECRTELDELHETVAGCVRYRKTVLAACLPPPPNAWADLRHGFERIDAEEKGWSFRFPQWQRALAAAASVLAVCGVYYELRETPSVQAAALLKRAVAAADAKPAAGRAIRFRTRNRQITRTVGAAATAVRSADTAAVYALFQEAHYDWNDPLSAKAFQDWRGRVADGKDEVARSQDAYRIRTSTSEGELAAASITLREADLLPLEGRLEFRNQDWIEFSEITEPAVSESGVTAASRAEAPERAPVPSRAAAVTPGPTASITDELQVLAALHKIGADLGDPVDVTLSGGRVVVSGVGVPTQRQRQIHGILDAMPNVAVEFAEPRPATLPPDSAAAQPAAETANSGIQTRLEAELGGRPQFEKFSSQVLDWNDQAMSRAYALRRLAQGFPAGSEAGMAGSDRTMLRRLAREHMTELAGLVGNMQQALTPALVGLGGSASGSEPGAEPSAWQPAVEQLFQTARRVEKLLSLLSGATPGENTSGGLPSDLLRALSEERADLVQCKRLLGGGR